MVRWLFASVLLSGLLMAQSAPISVAPEYQEVAVSDTFSIYITIGEVSDLKGIDVRLSYEQDKIECISIDKGISINIFTEYINAFDNIDGNLECMAVISDTGSGIDMTCDTLCSIDFIALSETDFTAVTFEDIPAPIGNSESQVIPFLFCDGGVKILPEGGISEYDNIPIPVTLTLIQNFPNPFRTHTRIEYGIPKDSYVTLKVYNIEGQIVSMLESGYRKAGYHCVEWNGKNGEGERVSRGIYFYKLEVGSESCIKKMLLL